MPEQANNSFKSFGDLKELQQRLREQEAAQAQAKADAIIVSPEQERHNPLKQEARKAQSALAIASASNTPAAMGRGLNNQASFAGRRERQDNQDHQDYDDRQERKQDNRLVRQDRQARSEQQNRQARLERHNRQDSDDASARKASGARSFSRERDASGID